LSASGSGGSAQRRRHDQRPIEVEPGAPALLLDGDSKDPGCYPELVFTVELKDAAGGVPVHFHIMASPGLSESVVKSQREFMRELALSGGMRYYFLVTPDWVRGWDMADGREVFNLPSATLFAAYTGNDEAKIRDAGPPYLAELTQAWLADLRYHWQSRGTSAPGERDMQDSGVLGVVRSAKTAVTASL
jgi:hypothetical protein